MLDNEKNPIHIEDTVMFGHNISVLKAQAHMDKKLPFFLFNCVFF